MQKKWCIALLLALVCQWAESSPARLGPLVFDGLDTDLDDLTYEVEEEDLGEFLKQLESADAANKSAAKTSGFKKNNTVNRGSKKKHDIQNLKKLYKSGRVRDEGSYDDDDVYAVAEGVAAKAVGIKGNEDRTYRKGTKTRGFHRVHHKDEYKKDKVFYEDDETKGSINKVGAKGMGFKIGAGAGINRGHFHHDHKKGLYGKHGLIDRGFSNKEYNAYSDSEGFDGSFSDES